MHKCSLHSHTYMVHDPSDKDVHHILEGRRLLIGMKGILNVWSFPHVETCELEGEEERERKEGEGNFRNRSRLFLVRE